MKKYAILSATGRDRIGVADDLTKVLSDRRIDIEHSRMTALSGRFALIVQLAGEENNVTRLQHDLASLGTNLGFHLELEPIGPARASGRAREFVIESFSAGPSGIGAVTGLLKRHDINIEELETEAAAAAWNMENTFHMKARITIPASCSITGLREELRELERERDLDVVVRPSPTPASEYLAPTTAG